MRTIPVNPEVRWVLGLTKLCNAAGLLPFDMGPEGRIKLAKSKRRKFLSVANISLYCIYTIALVARYILIVCGKETDPTLTADLPPFIAAACFAGVMYSLILKRKSMLKDYFNRLLFWSQTFEQGTSTLIRPMSDQTNISGTASPGKYRIRTTICIFFLLEAQYALRLVTKPYMPHHLTSLLAEPREISFARQVLTVLQIWLWFTQFSLLALCAAMSFWHAQEMQKCLRYIIQWGSRILESKMLQSLKLYRSLKILQLEHNQIWSEYYCISVVVSVFLVIYNILAAVLAHSIKAILFASATWCIMSRLLSAVATHYNMSLRFLQDWKCRVASKYHRKYIMQFRPLCTSNGGFGLIDHQLQLTLLGIIIDNSVTLIMGYRID